MAEAGACGELFRGLIVRRKEALRELCLGRIDGRVTADLVVVLSVSCAGVRGRGRDKRGGQLRLRTRSELQASKIGKDGLTTNDARSRKRQARAPLTSPKAQSACLGTSHSIIQTQISGHTDRMPFD